MIRCFEITHDGAGAPGRSVPITGPRTVRQCAEAAAHAFDAADLASKGLPVGDLDGTSRVIEVRGKAPGPHRFRVHCRVVRRYQAVPIETKGECDAG